MIYSPLEKYPKIFKSIIRKFVFDLKYTDLIKYGFSNTLNTFLITMAVSNVFLVSINFLVVIILFTAYIALFYF